MMGFLHFCDFIMSTLLKHSKSTNLSTFENEITNLVGRTCAAHSTAQTTDLDDKKRLPSLAWLSCDITLL